MTKVRKALLVALPAVALVIGSVVGIAAAAGGRPTTPVVEQERVTSSVQQQAPANGGQVRLPDQVRLRDRTCDPVGDHLQDRDRLQVHDPVQDRDQAHDRLGDR